MKVVILGAGRRGIRLAKQLVEEKKDVLLLDENPEVVEKAMTNVDCLACVVNGTDIAELTDAGISGSDAFIALTNSDETNLVSCSIASSEFNIPITICAVKNTSYTKSRNLMGITHVINPFQETANKIYQSIDRGIYSDIINFENSSLVLYNGLVEQGSKFAGKLVKDIRSLIPVQFVIAAILRNGEAKVPSGDTMIQAGDTISLAAREENVESILSLDGKRSQNAKRIAIVGGTVIADFLIQNFDASKRKNITLIDSHKDICEEYAAKYPEILIINENIKTEGVFKQEGLENYDLLICLSEIDEQNILLASYSKFRGVKATIAVVCKNAEYLRIANHLDIDSIVSAQDASVDSIMKFLHGSNISTFHTLFDGSIEAFEYKVSSNSKLCNKVLKDIDMKGKGIITAVQKDNQTIIPNGNYKIEENDTLVLVTERKASSFIQDLIAEN